MHFIRAGLLIVALGSTLVCMAPVQALARARGWALRHSVQKGFCRLVCRIIGIEVSIVGALPDQGPRFVVCNHLSWTDIIALASVHPFVFLAKKEVSGWPVLGFLARLQGTVFVDRGARYRIAAVNAALADVLRGGEDLVIFAEGTSTDGAVAPRFNSSHFEALRGVDAVVVPTMINYSVDGRVADVGWYGDMTFLPHLWRLMKMRGLCCHIRFGQEIDARGKDRKALAVTTQEQAVALYQESQARIAG